MAKKKQTKEQRTEKFKNNSQDTDFKPVGDKAKDAVAERFEFETIGQHFSGYYDGMKDTKAPTKKDPDRIITNIMFMDEEDNSIQISSLGYLVSIIEHDKNEIEIGDFLEFQYVKDIDTGKGNPMKKFDFFITHKADLSDE